MGYGNGFGAPNTRKAVPQACFLVDAFEEECSLEHNMVTGRSREHDV